MLSTSYRFTSSQFVLQVGEQYETNPGCFGKSLALWLSIQLDALGYDTEVVPEDFGWCVVCARDNYLLWVGCSSEESDELLACSMTNPPRVEDVVWRVMVEVEIPFFMVRSHFKRLFGKLDTAAPLQALVSDVYGILKANRRLSFCIDGA